MTGINFKGMDYSRSLISDQFVQHPRWIGNPLAPDTLHDYDKIDLGYQGRKTIVSR